MGEQTTLIVADTEEKVIEKIVIIVDGENLNGASLHLAEEGKTFNIDYATLVRILIGRRQSIGKHYFIWEAEWAAGFFRFLTNQVGMTIHAIKQGEYETIDEAIIKLMPSLAQGADTIALVSGDGDFKETLDECIRKGKRIEIVTVPDMLSSGYLGVDGYKFVDLTELKDLIRRKDPVRRPPARSLEMTIRGILPANLAPKLVSRIYDLLFEFNDLDGTQLDETINIKPVERERRQ